MLWKQKLAVSATIARNTCTDVAIVSLMAGGTIVARVVFTATDRGATVAASVPRWAGAGIAVRTVLACTAILTGVH